MKISNRIPVRTDRLLRDLQELARFGGCPNTGGVSRPAFSPSYRAAADWLMDRMQSAGLSVRMDAAGNVIGRLGPAQGAAIVCGSHIDSVPLGGKYDGALGVLAGLEVARCIAASAASLERALEIVAFADEEGAFLGELGARAMIGDITCAELSTHQGRDGASLMEAMTSFGLDPSSIAKAARPASDFDAYVELHIEQGPVLEKQDIEIGVVDSIVGLHTSEMLFFGQANHAGTTPLDLRCDAFRAAAETVTEAFATIERDFSSDLRLTYGVVNAYPGASNVVPGRARLTQEIRASDDQKINAAYDMTLEVARRVSQKQGVDVEIKLLTRDSAVAMSPRVIDCINTACQRHGISSRLMPSGAGHDAQVFAQICDTGMIFIPSQNGISHNPEEYSTSQQIEKGARILSSTLHSLLGISESDLSAVAHEG